MDYARERAKLIDPGRARCDVPPGNPPAVRGDTIYLSVVDRDGNIVSLIQSVYEHFGSGVVVDDYGFALQNRGGLFVIDPVIPTRWRRASGRCIRSSRRSWRRAMYTWDSASWAG